MNLKKFFAAFLAVVLLLGCLPFAASAANDPTVLFVGEKNKTDDNLITMFENGGTVYVYAIDRQTAAYYTLTKEKNVGYVLTFYNNYTMSEIISNYSDYCGLYCDGDLTVRIAGDVTFDANNAIYRGAFGWKVDGTLTIEGDAADAKLTVNGDKSKYRSGDGNIGICADTVKIHDVTVNANGGYAGIVAEEALVMASATLYANTAADMKQGNEPQFEYSIVTKNFIQVNGTVRADGEVDIAAFYFRGGNHYFDEKVVVYGKDYAFAELSYGGKWTDSFTLFRDPNGIPSCMVVGLGSSVAQISGNKVLLHRRGTTSMTLFIQCGRETIVMDSRTVDCQIIWWQWIPYILSGDWVDGLYPKN